MILIFKNFGERSAVESYCPVSLLSVVSKIFVKLVNDGLVDHIKKRGLFWLPVGCLDKSQIF